MSTKTPSKPKRKAPGLSIMDSVDILDRVTITLFQTVPGHYEIDFQCMEKGKQLIIDEQALKTLNNKLNEQVRGKDNNENTQGYIKEFVGRLLQAYHKNDLAIIEDIPDAASDPYAKFRHLN